MSLILEALRKSEAERQRGRLPALATGAPPAPALHTSRASSWKWPLLGTAALALVLVAWLAGAGWMRRDAVPVSDGAPATASTPTPVQTPPPATTNSPADEPAHADVLPPIDRLAPPAVPVPARQDPPAPTRAVARDGAPVRVDSARAAGARPTPIATAPSRVNTASTNEGTPSASPAMPPTDPDAILSLADLDPATRKALPPLHVSMHLWDADPTRRFVILDGNRRAEGDRVGPAVVTAITRDGVTLEWNGRRIQVPLR